MEAGFTVLAFTKPWIRLLCVSPANRWYSN